MNGFLGGGLRLRERWLPSLAQTLRDAGKGPRLQTLVGLRWLAVFGQTAAVLFVDLVLDFPLPLGLCLLVIATSAWLNLFLALRWRTTLRLHDRFAALLLGYDILQLAALLWLTGGLENPFSFLFLVPVTVSATTLPLSRTLWLGALALALASILAVWHLPLPWPPEGGRERPAVYVAGMWTAIVCGRVFSALYANRQAEEARLMSNALSATELVLAREQQLTALDGLAAAAGHELGTPLATIALVAKELRRELPGPGPIGEDLDLLISQSNRCREILSRLADRSRERDAMYATLRLTEMIEEIVTPMRGGRIEFLVDAGPSDGRSDADAPEPMISRNPAIKYGIGNLIENAADFAALQVEIQVGWTGSALSLSIADDGPGFSQEVIDRLGEPYVTTRRGYGAAPRQGHEGMGLGFFIAKTLLEKSGAAVTLANRDLPLHGAIVRAAWPRRAVEAVAPDMAGRVRG
ncbi:MAG: ActS/PrrB/RegB family redox-sensitive histidine kinase [Parvibaculaceae bacterium]